MITIEIKEAQKVYGKKSAFISFPYDMELVNLMREQQNRFWHAGVKKWEISFNHVENVLKNLTNRKYEIIDNFKEETKKETKEQEKEPFINADGFEFKTKPFLHQIEGFEFGLKNDRFLLGDEQGLGKTKQVIDIAVAKKRTRGYKHCLIICGVNGLKWNWREEIKTHSNEHSLILGTKYTSKLKMIIGSNKDKLNSLNNLPDAYFLITNVESLRNKDICDKIKELCDKKIIGMVAIDEIHKCKNPASQQGKAILKIRPETRIAMTGTPLMNTPLDLFIVLKWLEVEKHSFYQFRNYYCLLGGFGGYEVVGYRNLSQLQNILESFMLRRLKKDVLDLPEKIYTTEYVEMGKEQESIYREVITNLKKDIDKIRMHASPLSQLIRLRQATGFTGILSSDVQKSAKIDRLEEIIEELVENNKKCIVFSNWTGITNEVVKRLKRFSPAVITGETQNRENEVNKFMDDENCKFIVGTIGAMGTGLTLTKASTVIFLDSPWNRANKEQAEDRAHRIGTKEPVNIITLVCKDTIDERIEELIYKKGQMADLLVDGKIKRNKQQIVDFLLTN